MKPSPLLALCTVFCATLAGAAFGADAPPPAAPPTEVVLFDHGKVDHTFRTGGPLQVNSLYKVQAGRRVAAGPAEIHMRDTDIFYIVDGSATFVTGGTPVDRKEVGPNEFHAKSIEGGDEHHLSKGDVIVIPHGIAHQFTAVDGTFLYFVVKVTE